jgi:hypothetical protein
MAMNGSSEATAVGRVVAVNERGIRFEGAENWANISKFAVGITLPSKGDVVAVTFDKSGFIRAVTAADGSALITAPKTAHTAPSGQERDRTITRLAVLRSAVQLAQGRDDLSSADVLRVAERFEAWVLRPQDGAETDA